LLLLLLLLLLFLVTFSPLSSFLSLLFLESFLFFLLFYLSTFLHSLLSTPSLFLFSPHCLHISQSSQVIRGFNCSKLFIPEGKRRNRGTANYDPQDTLSTFCKSSFVLQSHLALRSNPHANPR
jgi:hypothetical protein